MREKDLDRAFGETPPAFTERINQTLARLDDRPRRIPRLRAALIAAAVLALLCGIAYAVIVQGQAWYYNNRFTAYQEHEPRKHQAIMDSLQIVTQQEQTEGMPVRVTVQDAAWVPQEKLLTVSLRAVEADPRTQELHPMWNLDPDGSYVGDDAEALAEDEEARSEHWLLTEKGFGPVREMMRDGTKELLLFEADRVMLGTPDNAVEILGNGSSMDSFVGEDDAVITVLKMELPWLDESYDAQVMAVGPGGRRNEPVRALRGFPLCGGRRRGPVHRRGERLGQLPHPGGRGQLISKEKGPALSGAGRFMSNRQSH